MLSPHTSFSLMQPCPAAAGVAGPGTLTPPAPWRVCERPRHEPVVLHVLAGARELRFVSTGDLPVIVRVLEQAGHVVLVRYDAERQSLAYYAQRAQLPGPARRPLVDDPPQRGRGGGDAAQVLGLAREARGMSRAGETPRAPDGERLARGYEDEGSQRLSRGAVTVSSGAWWSVVLTVAEGGAGIDEGAVFLRVERHGPPSGRVGDVEVDLSLADAEIDAVVALLAGIVEQARRDGVLPPGIH